jgi:hypothetical protein
MPVGRAVGIEPQLDGESVSKRLWLVLELQHVDRPQRDKVVEFRPVRRMGPVESPLALGEQGPDPSGTGGGVLYMLVVDSPLERARAHEPAGHRVDLDGERRIPADVVGDLVRHHRTQLYHGVTAGVLDPPGAHHHAHGVQRQVRSVEEVHLPNVGVERVQLQRGHACPVLGLRNCELELHTVCARH